jgi:hypothetical protein
MTGKIEWLRSEEECRYSVSYLRRKATADEWELLHPGNGHRGVKMNARTTAETWIHVLRGAGHKEIIRSLQNNLRQRRIQKRTKPRRFNLPPEACAALNKLTKEFETKPSETLAILLKNSPKEYAALKDKWKKEHEGKIGALTYENLCLKQAIKSKDLETSELIDVLRKHVMEVEMWRSATLNEPPPFEGDRQTLENKVNSVLEALQESVRESTRIKLMLPDPT